jgi:hypothetical protein
MGEKMFKYGESYLIVENDFEKVFSVFAKLVSSDRKGMVVWRIHPQKDSPATKGLKGKQVKTKWITNISTKEEHLNPHELEQLSYDIEHFMEGSKGSVVVLFCIEYLISFNSFSDILHLVQTIKDYASEYGCIFMVHVGVGTLEKQQESLLRQELVFTGDVQ